MHMDVHWIKLWRFLSPGIECIITGCHRLLMVAHDILCQATIYDPTTQNGSSWLHMIFCTMQPAPRSNYEADSHRQTGYFFEGSFLERRDFLFFLRERTEVVGNKEPELCKTRSALHNPRERPFRQRKRSQRIST
jgi:hypothetical protein